MKLNLRLSHKGLVLVAVPLLFELAIFGALALLVQQSEEEAARAAYFKTVTAETNGIVTDMYQVVSTLITYHLSKTDNANAQYQLLMTGLPIRLRHLRDLTHNDPIQQKDLDRIEGELKYVLDFVRNFKKSVDAGDTLSAFYSVARWSEAIRGPFNNLIEDLHGLVKYQTEKFEVDPQEEARLRDLIKLGLLIAVAINVVVATSLAALITRGMTRRIEALQDNTVRLAQGGALTPIQPGNDEIASLDVFFHKMAQELSVAARKERAIVENALDVICSLDAEGRFSKVSPASLKVWGYAPKELIGTNCTNIVVSDDKAVVSSTINEIVDNCAESSFETSVCCADGRIVNMLWSARWVSEERSLFCVVHDITERKLTEDVLRASEARIRSIIENMVIGLVVLTDDGQIETVNPRTIALYKGSPEQLVGNNILALLPNLPVSGTDSYMDNLKKRALGRVEEVMARRENGELFPVELTMSDFESTNGHRYLLNLLDVTERHEIEELKKEFVAMVSHDLRTPLSSILGSLSLLSQGNLGALTDSGRKVVADSERELNRLIQLINDLLDIARMESGRLELNLAGTTLSSIIERSINAVNGIAQQRKVKITAQPTEAEVIVDSERLIQVLVNLLSNALKFAPEGSEVTITSKETADWFEVRVTDTGPGIPQSFRETIFQRFTQVDPLDSAQRRGAGLGLSICKAIVDGHHGTIGVDSEVGKGSTFWFRLPVTL